jgi:hypothetical protein
VEEAKKRIGIVKRSKGDKSPRFEITIGNPIGVGNMTLKVATTVSDDDIIFRVTVTGSNGAKELNFKIVVC